MNQMCRLASIVFVLSPAMSCGIGTPSVEPQAGPGPVVAFTGANVIPMDTERILRDQLVLVVEGRIVSIEDADAGNIPEGSRRIDASGQYLIPALCDMHVHLEGEAWNVMFPPEAQFPPEAFDFENLLFPYVANGVATVQVMSALPEHIELREQVDRGEFLAPRLVLSRMVDGPGRAWPPPISTWVSSAKEARQAVLDIHREGYDSIKVYSFLDRESYQAIITSAREVGMPVGGHIPLGMSLEEVLAAGQISIAHSEELLKVARSPFTNDEIETIASTIADSGIWITPTLTTSRNILAVFEDFEGELARPEIRYLHPMDLGIWSFIHSNLYQPVPQDQREAIRDGYEQFQRPLTRALAAAGARLMTGTDALIPSNVPGFSIHDELAELVDVGLSPYDALRSSTTEPFAFLGELDQAGTIAVGKRADLVLLDDNPLVDIAATRNISGVMIRGRWIARDEILEHLEELAATSQAETE